MIDTITTGTLPGKETHMPLFTFSAALADTAEGDTDRPLRQLAALLRPLDDPSRLDEALDVLEGWATDRPDRTIVTLHGDESVFTDPEHPDDWLSVGTCIRIKRAAGLIGATTGAAERACDIIKDLAAVGRTGFHEDDVMAAVIPSSWDAAALNTVLVSAQVDGDTSPLA